MTVKLLTEQHLEILSLKGGCRDLSKSKYVKMPLSLLRGAMSWSVVGDCGISQSYSLVCFSDSMIIYVTQYLLFHWLDISLGYNLVV